MHRSQLKWLHNLLLATVHFKVAFLVFSKRSDIYVNFQNVSASVLCCCSPQLRSLLTQRWKMTKAVTKHMTTGVILIKFLFCLHLGSVSTNKHCKTHTPRVAVEMLVCCVPVWRHSKVTGTTGAEK